MIRHRSFYHYILSCVSVNFFFFFAKLLVFRMKIFLNSKKQTFSGFFELFTQPNRENPFTTKKKSQVIFHTQEKSHFGHKAFYKKGLVTSFPRINPNNGQKGVLAFCMVPCGFSFPSFVAKI